MNDPIVEEIHQVREAIAAECGNDLAKIVAHFREQQEASKRAGRHFVTRSPRPLGRDNVATNSPAA